MKIKLKTIENTREKIAKINGFQFSATDLWMRKIE
jgi:hypothetical protein